MLQWQTAFYTAKLYIHYSGHFPGLHGSINSYPKTLQILLKWFFCQLDDLPNVKLTASMHTRQL